MPNSIRNDFHSDLATTISNEIQFKRSNYYYFIGKVNSWGTGDISPTSIPLDSELENTNIRTNAIFLKKITPNDVSLVVARYDWIVSTVFDIWDNTRNMSGIKFYCVNSENNVYKCLDNAGGIVSTTQPLGKSFYAFRTTDGYLWKYMYTIPSFKRSRFLSLNYIPVQKSLTDSFYNKGSVDAVVVSNGGVGYLDSLLTSVSVTGTTTGSGAAGYVTVGATGNITGVVITNGGSGYTAGVTVGFVSAIGSGGVGVAIIAAGVVTGITITSGGVGYASSSLISFTVGGAVIIPMVSRITGSITGLKIIKSGKGYATAPTLTATSATGTGKYGNATALLSAVVYQGSITIANIIDPGINYLSDSSTNIVVTGDGSDAVFSPVIYNGSIVDVVVENSGVGYTGMKLNVTGAGSGAILTPITASSDFTSEQHIVEQTTVVGAIYSIKITNFGNNYSHDTIVNITGDGTGAVATPVISNGQIKNIIVTSFGREYTYANVSFTDPIRSIVGVQIDAIAYAILPPRNGHGFDAVSELYGKTLAINTSLRQDGLLNSISQDYRQFGILKDPTDIATGKILTDSSSLMTYNVIFTNVIGLIIDEILIQNNIKFRVIYINGNSVVLQQLGVKYIDPIGTLIAEANSSRVYTSTSITKYPIANKYSGSLLYVSNENPFSFTQDQGVIIKTFLKF